MMSGLVTIDAHETVFEAIDNYGERVVLATLDNTIPRKSIRRTPFGEWRANMERQHNVVTKTIDRIRQLYPDGTTLTIRGDELYALNLRERLDTDCKSMFRLG